MNIRKGTLDDLNSILDPQQQLLSQLKRTDSLDTIQNYIKQVITMRGFGQQPVEQELLLLTEEIGELAKAIRKDKTNMAIDNQKIKNYDSIESEIADVFIVLTSICNTLNINLYDAIIEKEQINIERNWTNNSKKD